jgi:predicted transcriptional regulator YheO
MCNNCPNINCEYTCINLSQEERIECDLDIFLSSCETRNDWVKAQNNMSKEEIIKEILQWIWNNENKLDESGLMESINKLATKIQNKNIIKDNIYHDF